MKPYSKSIPIDDHTWLGVVRRITTFAFPTFLFMVMNSGVLIFELWLISHLGAEALAAFSLCLPLILLMITMSAGGLGGGVTSAVARSLGNTGRNRSVIRAALILGGGAGIFFALAVGLNPGVIFSWLSSDAVLVSQAVDYAVIYFLGAPLIWLSNTLAGIHRGLAQPGIPAKVGAVSIGLQLLISYPLILGIGSYDGMGLTGAALVRVIGFGIQVVLLWRALDNRFVGEPLLSRFMPVGRHHFYDVLIVGLPSSFNTLVAAIISIVLTGLASGMGIHELGGYGVSTRFEAIIFPVMFSIGTSLIALVGMAWGAGDEVLARRYVTAGAWMSLVLTSGLGIALATAPLSFLQFFSGDIETAQAAKEILVITGPTIGLLGFGLAYSFGCQGIKRPLPALTATLTRLMITILIAAFLPPTSLTGLSVLAVSGMVLFAVVVVMSSGPLFPWAQVGKAWLSGRVINGGARSIEQPERVRLGN
ncbi:MAG: MATE family efflux transporter [Verrucomicrobiota bacterium]